MSVFTWGTINRHCNVFVMGNDDTGASGEFKFVALYPEALTGLEVQENVDSGFPEY